jgi:hypothetical protein
MRWYTNETTKVVNKLSKEKGEKVYGSSTTEECNDRSAIKELRKPVGTANYEGKGMKICELTEKSTKEMSLD